MLDEKTEIIYVSLLDEPVEAWRPVDAVRLEENTFKITSANLYPDDERWQFVTGEVVLCKERQFPNGPTCLVAVEKIDM